ncbi:alpha-galactosidase [Parabacteroides sp. PF5-5]|uniref:alpha-galactosidase n=1 Tax=unclassified Parabacteroides TaxID=2649774 RepID=UPI002475C801|nr:MULTISPECIES: alpha-galactosidase [unclassified Parabacteroides]MDH6305483.1 alpha-galactosidase [Parabacteroides sp. PH5-39]MDH6316193.1 alpha-galactosidase [Parabacteroides sp. PF5-13]MDH6320343.1 alpha-galactosidase [Parabacteroides sp. PH5-13]MDH6324073.1 alpha-galactosidase [Parabacteroides sp. PH5-8]MDH6327384.1 alpha-galactosidase [Parabacteroides sp. PH5-41]
MKKELFLCMLLLFCFTQLRAKEAPIRISTNETDLIFSVAPNGRLYQAYLGPRLQYEADLAHLSYWASAGSDGSNAPRGWEVYPASGAEDYFEPALALTHNDGNMTTILSFVSSESKKIDDNVTETTICLKDKVYPVDVTLHYLAYKKENVIKTWSEIRHKEKKPVSVWRYASNMLYFENSRYFLTEYSGDWAKEVNMSTQELQYGKKILDTKLGSRAAMHVSPFFEVGLDAVPSENEGNVLMGTLGWTGNFQFTFEVDNAGSLRIISGINPYASNYELKPDEVFATPEFIFTLSNKGTGQGSRNFHDWARAYQLKDGKGDRLTLLNNWEATYFDFDEKKLEELMKEAKSLGVDMFLLDDGWFANKYPRENDKAGLGDWEVTKSKLPNGVPHLVKSAKEAGVKFGIWIEPEMVNPKSELFEKHPDWAIRLPNRETYYYRNQLVLDMSNPAVQNYVFGVVENIMKENLDLAYFKWDCNSPITNIYSPYLKEKQNQLYVDHVRGVYNVFRRVKEQYPDLPMMLCSGGGARCDYEALKYFTEFWCSDNTDPVERLFIQWGFSHFFPVKSMAAHVTSWNKRASIKFRTDVAMMCKLGFDISLKEMDEKELTYCQTAVSNYNRLKKVILDGDFYRLVSPYESNHTAVMHVAKGQDKALLYAYDIHPRFGEKLLPVKLQGLDPAKTYKVEEINLMPGTSSRLQSNGKTYTGDYLMKVGLSAFTTADMSSRLIEITQQL